MFSLAGSTYSSVMNTTWGLGRAYSMLTINVIQKQTKATISSFMEMEISGSKGEKTATVFYNSIFQVLFMTGVTKSPDPLVITT